MIVGIDVSKRTLDVALLRPKGKPLHKVFTNDAGGHEALLAWLVAQGAEASHICLEATGTWAADVALMLHGAGHRVSLVNPAQIHAFGRSSLTRTKTDKADAVLIARFCEMHQPPAWTPLSPQLQQLQGLIRRLEHLDEMLTMEKNRLSSGGAGGAVQQSIREHIAYLEEQIWKSRWRRRGVRSATRSTMIPISGTTPVCSKASPELVLQRPRCSSLSWEI